MILASPPGLALAGYAAFLLLAFGLRTLLHWRRTGSSGFVGITGRVGSVEWLGGVLFVLAAIGGAAAPLAQLAGWTAPLSALDAPGVRAAGGLLMAAGIAATLLAQLAMGDSWRIGVDRGARTALVASGPFAWVRNPIFSSMLVTTAGIALLVPNPWALAALAALGVALEIQVRLVEEPWLLRTHGERYRGYAARTGRFWPGVGRLPSSTRQDGTEGAP